MSTFLTYKKQNNFIERFFRITTVFLVVFSIVFALPIQAQLTPEERSRLEAELADLEKEIKEQQAILDGQKNKSASLQRDIQSLQARINVARANIQKKDLEIKKIGTEITNKSQTITSLNSEIERNKRNLAQLVRKTHEMDHLNFTHAVLSSQSVSDFYGDLNTYSSLKRSVQDSVNVVRGVRLQTEEVKKQLEDRQVAEIDAKKAIEQERARVEQNEKEQKKLLSISKNQEAEYAKILAERQAQAAQIRARLFELRGQGAIPFGEAYAMAKAAGAKTGVRPAFILAILRQESNLGANVGTCNRPGDPLEKTWRKIMPGPEADRSSRRDDQSAFLRITSKLGISPDGQPLSCPWGGGWGGAMGPSQFIPTTWESYEKRVASAVGSNIANPWNPAHAIMATALFVQDLGASAKTHSAERNAACRYYSGAACTPGRTPPNVFYGDQVMGHAASFQKDIDFLESL